VYIREATQNDNEELQQLQARCPQGTTLIVSTVNTPDFFARVKAYSDYKVYVATEDNRIVGSTACVLRSAMIKGKEEKIGNLFQAFVDPDYRGRRIAGQMHQASEEYLRQQGVALGYSLIMEGNIPSMHFTSREGFQRHCTIVMPGLAVFKEMPVGSGYKIRTAVIDDLPNVADLLNETWQDYELYELKSAEQLQQFISRTPGYDLDNLFLLEEGGNIIACLGFWDWSQVMKITVERLNSKMRLFKVFVDLARLFRPMPSMPRAGELLKQIMLTPIGFKHPKYLVPLLRHINNLARQRGIGLIYCVCEQGHPLLSSLQGFTHIDTAIHVYIKYFRENAALGNKPLFIDGIDL
jgi:N-acetylglutamate synthase-like GNAT family acetyltransferase